MLIRRCCIFSRESDGSFHYGNYRREADDLRAVIQHFRMEKRVITAITGHSKGLLMVPALYKIKLITAK